MSDRPYISVVIPVYNEAVNLERLMTRLLPVLDRTGRTHEIVFIDDGSHDDSPEILKRFFESHRKTVRVVLLNRNYGQHAAILAGMEVALGEIVVTLDADLQNPPEEIPKLLAKIEEGYDVVGGWRRNRLDSWYRKTASRMVNRLTSKITGVSLKDYGCMLRAYRSEVVDSIRQCKESSTFIPALANLFARRITEIEVEHEERIGGGSKYTFQKLIGLQYDLMTGFSILPLRALTFFGFFVSSLGLAFAVVLIVRRLVLGPEVEGVFTLFAILFFFVGAQFLAFGLLGEYIGRIYQEVRERPRFIVKRVLSNAESEGAGKRT